MAHLSKIEELKAPADQSGEEPQWHEASHDPEAFEQNIQALRQIDHRPTDRLLKQKFAAHPGIADWLPDPVTDRIFRYVAIAASVLLFIGGLYWITHSSRQEETSALRTAPTLHATLHWLPGPDWKALEKTPSSILLEELAEDSSYSAGLLQIVRMGDIFFVHQLPHPNPDNSQHINYTLSVEGDADVHLFFYDGTWVQASPHSSVSFVVPPSGESIKERKMICAGRFLFDVNKDSHTPFIVETPKQLISVLGTLFRVLDYNKKDTGEVLCYDGAVRVEDQYRNAYTLKALQRITTPADGAPQVSTGDFPAVRWPHPELSFDFGGISLDSAMKQIAHWYGYTRVEKGAGVDGKNTSSIAIGKISRYFTLTQLFAILNRTDLHFTIKDDKTLLVTK